MTIQVFNMAQDEFIEVDATDPRQAVIVAHAENCGDFDREHYEERYGQYVKVGKISYGLGDFAARKELKG